MPPPKRSSVNDFFDQLTEKQRPHLEALRKLSLETGQREELRYNQPAYLAEDGTQLWMLQSFKNHCSLRFSTEFFGTQKAAVEDAGYESGAGFLKLTYDGELPVDLCKQLMQARLDDFAQTHAG